MIPVVEEDRSCVISATSNPLHIMRSLSSRQTCGTTSQPWILEAPLGQQINVSLLDFGTKRRTGDAAETRPLQRHCHGYLLDKSVKRNVSICAALGNERYKAVYKTSSNIVEVVLNSVNSQDGSEEYGSVLLRFVGNYMQSRGSVGVL